MPTIMTAEMPNPWTKRKAITGAALSINAVAKAAMVNMASPMCRIGRRPNRSASAPVKTCPAAAPAVTAARVILMAPAEALKPACMAAKAGSAESIASGPKKVTPPRTRKVRRKGLNLTIYRIWDAAACRQSPSLAARKRGCKQWGRG